MKGLPEKAYLGEESLDTLTLDSRVSPCFAASHAGLAPAILPVGIYDFLFDDDVAYAKILGEANVPLIYCEYPTLNHGFSSYTAISNNSLDAAQQVCGDLKRLLDAA